MCKILEMDRARLLVTAVCLLMTFFLISCAPKNEKAVVIFVSGSAELSRAGSSVSLKVKDELQTGDIIKTGPDSYAMIQIGGEIMARIQSDTSVELKKVLEQDGTELSLGNGQVVSRVKKLQKGSEYNIRTLTAVASVRGTSYSVSYYRDRSVLAVKEGKVELVTEAGGVTKDKRERMIETGSTIVIDQRLAVRPINEFESLEIEKLSAVPYGSGSDMKNDAALAVIGKKAEDEELRIQKEIIARGGPIPKTLEEMRKRFGRINEITLYNNKKYTGVILAYGVTVKMMTLDGIIVITSSQIKATKR